MPIVNSMLLRVSLTMLCMLGFLIMTPAMQAQTNPIVTGYGETTWGQSLADVQAIWPGGETDEQRKLFLTYTASAAADEAPIIGRVAQFYNDQLYSIVIFYELPDRPEEGADEDGLAVINDLIKKKYHLDREAKDLMQLKHRMRIEALAKPDGTIQVTYENIKMLEATDKAMREKKEREDAERRAQEPRTKKLKALGLEESI